MRGTDAPMIARLRQLHGDQSGFTLPELLTAMVVGMFVLMGAFLLIDHSTSMSAAVADRQDAVQRGRAAMENMVTALRSQVCLGENTEPITFGSADAVTFYANLSANSDTAQQRSIVYNATAKTITQEIRDGTGVYPDLKFPTKPTQVVTLLQSAGRMVEDGVTQPILRYYTYKVNGAPGELQQLSVPLTADDASRVVMVKIAFFAKPDTRAPSDRNATSLQSNVYVRLADPTRPAEGPRCI
jgi:prepilin-type N-terminal cleavage/methylation domain-containing protein